MTTIDTRAGLDAIADYLRRSLAYDEWIDRAEAYVLARHPNLDPGDVHDVDLEIYATAHPRDPQPRLPWPAIDLEDITREDPDLARALLEAIS